MLDHKKADQIREAAARRLLNHMHAFDVSAAVTGEMSIAKADGNFARQMEDLLRTAVTRFNPGPLLTESELDL